MDATFDLVAVAFLRSAGGRVRVLLAVDRDGKQLFDGDPALLIEHRPGAAATDLVVEGADGIAQATLTLLASSCARDLADLVDRAHDEYGQLIGERLLDTGVTLRAPGDSFDRW